MLRCLPYFRAVLCAVLIYTTSSSYGQILTTWPCHAVSENAPTPNYYFSYDPVTNSWSEVGMTNTTSIESIAYDPISDILYAFDAGDFGVIDQATGAFTVIVAGPIFSSNGAYGAILLDDIDGLSYDPVRDVLWASHRESGLTPDVLFQVDPNTGMLIPNAFGPGVDYVVVPSIVESSGSTAGDIDDIAYDPYTGVLYAIQNQAGSGGTLTTIDLMTGAPTIVGSFGVDDMEGLGFTYLGELFGSTGNNGPNPNDSNRFYNIDINTGLATEINGISDVRVDFESFDCFSAYNDQALTKMVSPSQSLPIYAGQTVTFDIVVINQGNMPVTNIEITDYIPNGLILTDPNWVQSGSTASMTLSSVMLPGDQITSTITFTVDANFSGTLTNGAEISDVDFTDGMSTYPVDDVDSVADSNGTNDETVDNQTDGGGPVVDEDEDDMDIATIEVSACPANLCLPITATRN